MKLGVFTGTQITTGVPVYGVMKRPRTDGFRKEETVRSRRTGVPILKVQSTRIQFSVGYTRLPNPSSRPSLLDLTDGGHDLIRYSSVRGGVHDPPCGHGVHLVSYFPHTPPAVRASLGQSPVSPSGLTPEKVRSSKTL